MGLEHCHLRRQGRGRQGLGALAARRCLGQGLGAAGTEGQLGVSGQLRLAEGPPVVKRRCCRLEAPYQPECLNLARSMQTKWNLSCALLPLVYLRRVELSYSVAGMFQSRTEHADQVELVLCSLATSVLAACGALVQCCCTVSISHGACRPSGTCLVLSCH